MNEQQRQLIRHVCDGDIRKAQQQAQIILNETTTQKDRQFCEYNLRKLANRGPELIELPPNLRDVLIAEDVTNFPTTRFLLRDTEKCVVERILVVRNAADRLHDLGIQYSTAAILYGESGTGKTMLARYIAHKANLPFVYIRFSGLMNSYLGGTQSNLNRVFDYARTNPCVLCLDEMDAVGMRRGQKDDIGEMNRIVISLMQELDRMESKCILVGTTNRFDRLDPALIRRFPISFEVCRLSDMDARQLIIQIFGSIGMELDNIKELVFEIGEKPTAAAVYNTCVQYAVDKITKEAT